jgi:rhamnosyltransferase
MNPSSPPISVVIRTKNNAATLKAVIAGLGLAGEDELIIVDSGSQDATLAVAGNAGARIIDLSDEPFSYGKSLNRGFAVARHDWILALSSHCVPVEPCLLEKYRRILPEVPMEVSGIVGGVYGRAEDVKKNPALEICTPVDFQKNTYFTCINPNSLYRKAAWTKHPFDEQLKAAEDLAWSIWELKIGHSLMRHTHAAVFYRSRLGLLAMFRKGHLDARVAKRLVSNPPITVAQLFKEIIWNFLAVLRGRSNAGFSVKRICYFTGAFFGDRAK